MKYKLYKYTRYYNDTTTSTSELKVTESDKKEGVENKKQ